MRAWLVLVPFLAISSACLGMCRPNFGECKVEDANSAIAKRGELIVQALAKDPNAIISLGTDARAKAPADVVDRQVKAAQEIAKVLLLPHTLERVWHWQGSGLFAGCQSSNGVLEGFSVTPAQQDSAVVFYVFRGEPSNTRMSMFLQKERGEYRLDSLALYPESQRGKTAQDFADLAEQQIRAGKELSALISLIAAHELSSYPEGIVSEESVRIQNRLQEFGSKERLERLLSQERVPRKDPLLNLSMQPSEFGLMPVFKFVTPSFGDDAPARELYAHIAALAPELRDEFSKVRMRGFREPPLDPQRQYEAWDTIIDTASIDH